MSAAWTACSSCLVWMPSISGWSMRASMNGQIAPPAYPKYFSTPTSANQSAIASTTRIACSLLFLWARYEARDRELRDLLEGDLQRHPERRLAGGEIADQHRTLLELDQRHRVRQPV